MDRIAHPWGERTPFGRDGEWPVRMDQFLEDGVNQGEVDAWVQTASILHSNGDAMDIAVRDRRIVGVRGRGVDRVSKGRLGPKDLFGWQANNSEDRLKKPLVRKNGELVEAEWDEAFDRIVGESKRLLEEKGPLAFAFGLGQLSDIALKGLSPSVNDPTTAMQAMDRVEAIFVALGEKSMPASLKLQRVGGREVFPKIGYYDFEDVVGLAFDQVRRAAFTSGEVAVLERLLEILGRDRGQPPARTPPLSVGPCLHHRPPRA